ncbi:MAG TPA: TolC family protein [Pyrinomonadaceae bacterium]|jgi:cobalt-zinc-cadmium efflux system outer membrane protein
MLFRKVKFSSKQRFAVVLIWFALFAPYNHAQEARTVWISEKKTVVSIPKYLDLQTGKTADELVAYALANNAELAAMRSEATAAEALVRQASLRPNPNLEVSGTRQIGGMDNSLMVQGSLPLELGGRRGARIRVAERELEIRRLAVAERERQLAAEVRAKFGESLAAAYKLRFTEEMLALANENYQIVVARVEEGRRPPLEQNVETVELNRLRAMRETSEATVEIRLLELRNLVGMSPEEPLRVSGSFEDLLVTPVPQTDSVENALARRPDLQGARAVEQLAQARIEQARSEGKIDADAMLGYQRMRTGFPLRGIDEAGNLQPIENRMNFFTFGVTLNLPVRNRNQGMIAAAAAEEEAARLRRQFGELTIRREVAAAYVRFNGAARAMQIYRVGVREQAAENLGVVRQVYEIGAKPLFDYIAEQRRFIETESGFIDAQLETYLARIEILRAANAPELTNK